MAEKKLIQFWLIFGVIAGFCAIVFFITNYVHDEILCDVDCGVKNEVTAAVVLAALIGIFAGSLTYYFLSEKYEFRLGKMHKDLSATYKFLDSDSRKIIESIISLKGEATQAEIVNKTKLSRVKISREIKQLELKGIIKKSKKGMTNKISLSKDLFDLFLK
ncbi:hypothetical protein JXM83_04955 [Candidatus Woesearchaeota archaeon]|nr:hypothetical protein [Candidatus Woesearchaeota archaeon]